MLRLESGHTIRWGAPGAQGEYFLFGKRTRCRPTRYALIWQVPGEHVGQYAVSLQHCRTI